MGSQTDGSSFFGCCLPAQKFPTFASDRQGNRARTCLKARSDPISAFYLPSAFCPSLLAGQGAALAMIAAYVLSNELTKSEGQPETAYQRYEERLRTFISDKQKAAEGFARSFTPKTRLGLFLRNQASKAFRVPSLAKLALQRSLVDRLTLPDYFPESRDVDAS